MLPRGGPGNVTIKGTVSGDGTVTLGRVQGPRRAPLPPECPASTAALRFSTIRSELERVDGWLVYYDESVDRVSPEAVGRLCVVDLGKGVVNLAFVKRGYERGTYALMMWGRKDVYANVPLKTASPVLWMKMT